MKIHLQILSLMPLLFISSCANVTIIGHERGYDLNAQLKADMTAPVSMNAGFESRTAVAVPPRKSMMFSDLFSRLMMAEGDALSTISRIDVTRVHQDDKAFDGINYLSVLATGKAATQATRLAATSATANEAGENAKTIIPGAAKPATTDGPHGAIIGMTEIVKGTL